MSSLPALLITYRRKSETQSVIEALREARVKSLFFWSNAPNPVNPTDQRDCDEVRKLTTEIDWDCKVTTNFQTEHLSARDSIVSAIDWFFSNVEEGIILEDDCVPSPDFFTFVEEMLFLYRDNKQIMHVSGTNHACSKPPDQASYYFSNYSHNWGWATWATAWMEFRNVSKTMDKSRIRELVRKRFEQKSEQSYWSCIFDLVKSGNLDTWDYSWMFTIWDKNGRCIAPSENLVSNIGFGNQATNTTNSNSTLASQVTGALPDILIHPSNLDIEHILDQEVADSFYKISRSYRLRHLKLRISRRLPVSVKRRIKRLFGI